MKDHFAEKAKNHNSEQFVERLVKKVLPKPYHEEHRTFRDFLLILSYVFNVVSAATAAYFVYSTTEKIVTNKSISIALAIVFLVFLEIVKRYSSSMVFKKHYFRDSTPAGWLTFSIIIMLFSVSSSYFGTNKGIKDFTPDDPKIDQIKVEIAQINADLLAQKKTTWKGKITTQANKNISSLLAQKKQAKKQLSEVVGSSTLSVANLAEKVAIVSLILELGFLAIMAYIWYFAKRTLLELHPELFQDADGDGDFHLITAETNRLETAPQIGFRFGNKTKKTPPPPQPKPETNQAETPVATEVSAETKTETVPKQKPETKVVFIKSETEIKPVPEQVKQLFRQIQSYLSKLEKGKGSIETNCRNVDSRLQNIKDYLEELDDQQLQKKLISIEKRYQAAIADWHRIRS